MIPIALAFLVAAAGVASFAALDLPLPWLLGPMVACLIAALIGIPMRSIRPINNAVRTVLGVAVGATITMPVLLSIPAMWPTLILVPFLILLCGGVGLPYFHRLWGYDTATAYYSAMPGGLQDMLVFGEEAGGNVRTLSLNHATRVLFIVAAAPALVSYYWGADLSSPPGRPIADVALKDLVLMVACAALGWWVAERINLFGAPILGPMIVTAAASIIGLLEGRPPAEAIWAAQFFIGMSIGTKYAGITLAEVRRDLTAGLGYCVLLVVITVIFVEIILHLDLAPGLDALLAFAPGGQAEMAVLALVIGADAAFVVTHHIVRIVLVIVGAPLAARWIAGARKR